MRFRQFPLALLLAVTTIVISAHADSDPAQPGHRASPASAGNIRWSSLNGGGKTKTSANYRLRASVGQTLIGRTTGSTGAVGGGYWRGVNSSGAVCSCPNQADLDSDTFPTVLDLGIQIDITFAGTPDVQDPSCPLTRSDFDCDSFTTLVDLGLLIDYLFVGGDPPCDPCAP